MKKIDKLIRLAVIFGVIGLCCIFVFLLYGFKAWSVGIGIFLGMPILLTGIVLYVIAVVRDLKKHDVIHE